MQEYVAKDWRDSLVTKAVAFTSVGALLLGSLKLVEYMDRKFCEQYGWLKKQPVEAQTIHANDAFNHSLVNEGYRTITVRWFLSDLQKCE